MKMQHELVAGVDGAVTEINFEAGAQIPADAVLLSIDTPE